MGGGSKPVQLPVIAEQQEPAALRRRVDHVAEPADLRHHAKRGVEDKKLVAPEDIEVFGRVHRPRRGREPGKGERRKVARWMQGVDTAAVEQANVYERRSAV